MKSRSPLPSILLASVLAAGGLVASGAGPVMAGTSTTALPPSTGDGGVERTVRAAADGDAVVPPAAVTGPPLAVGAGTATLAGAVIAGDSETTYSFEYGSTTGYGIGTPPQTLPAGTDPVVVQADITNLGLDASWHYRLVARSTSGTTYGADQTFTTSAPVRSPFVLSLPVDRISASTATAHARVDPGGRATQVTFQYGPTPALGSQTAAVSIGAGEVLAPVDVALTDLQPNTPYFVRAVATNDAGTSYGFTLPFTTPAAPTAITAEASLRTVTWGTGATIVGKVAGAGVDGSTVRLMKQGFPFAAPVEVATTKVESGGTYGFDTGKLFATTRFWVEAESAPTVRSASMTTYGKLRVRMSEAKLSSSRGTLSGSVSPSLEGATTTLQRRFGSERWKTVGRPELDRASAVKSTFNVRVNRTSRMAKYRLLVTPKERGAHYATASNVKGVKGR